MKLDKIANSKNDEFYTPSYAVEPLLKYIPRSSKIWCPFDTEKSLIVKSFQEHINEQDGGSVIHTHIDTGGDFFSCYEECDYIISNPPYSIKAEVFKRLFELDKPFAMLVGVVGLFESEKRFSLFEKYGCEIMWLNKRVSYFENYDDEKPSKNPPFSSVWCCSKVLPEKNIFERINKKG